MNFAYHLRGNLLGVNLDNTNNPTPKTTEGDLFSYKLDFENTGLYDGNIGKQTWQTADDKNLPMGVRSYTFSYDSPKRLKLATFAGIGSENYTLPNLSYDKNSNITNLQRNGKVGNAFGAMDNLSYAYNGNRLNQVTDAISSNNEVDLVPRGDGNYTYYNDGSLKSDDNERITNIIYDTYLKQPTELYLSDGTSIKHYYDGSSTLLKTLYSTNETWEFSGITYKNGLPFQMPTSEGRAVYQNTVWNFEFFYNDHLGNTRVGFRANGNQLVKTSETAFDPWGVVLRGVGQVNNTQNRFEYQNKEKESTFGLNRINLGARTVNPTIGRLDRVDNFADKYFGLSTYQYSANNPMRFIDVNGDSLWVNYNGTNILYQNGSLYDNKGNAYSGAGTKFDKQGNITGYKGFLGQALKALNSITSAEQNTGTTMVSDLQASVNNFVISDASNNPRNQGDNEYKESSINGSYAVAMLDARQGTPKMGGSGGTIYWNPNGGAVQEIGGGINVRPVSNLAHEMFHSYDSNLGLMDNRVVNGLKRQEWRASYYENTIRNQLGTPYREFYNTLNGPVKLLDTSNRPINMHPPSISWLNSLKF